MFSSSLKVLGAVPFPSFTGECVYMHEFFKKKGLPNGLSRWQPTVDALLEEVDTDGPIYLMVDQGMVKAGQPHRRPGVHVDGYWNPGVHAHGGGGHGSSPSGPRHAPYPRHHSGGAWASPDFRAHEALLLASDVEASRAFIGEWSGVLGDGGDASSVDLSNLQQVPLLAGIGYVGNVSLLHESLPIPYETPRTLVRLNVPGYSFH